MLLIGRHPIIKITRKRILYIYLYAQQLGLYKIRIIIYTICAVIDSLCTVAERSVAIKVATGTTAHTIKKTPHQMNDEEWILLYYDRTLRQAQGDKYLFTLSLYLLPSRSLLPRCWLAQGCSG